MNKKMTGGINVGTSSILVTFVLLCLVTFAALSFLSANSDYRLSKQTAQRTTDYYEGIEKLFADNEMITVNTETSPVTLTYDVPVSDTQNLHVCLAVAYPGKDDALFHIVSWRTQNIDIWSGQEDTQLLDDGIGFMEFD